MIVLLILHITNLTLLSLRLYSNYRVTSMLPQSYSSDPIVPSFNQIYLSPSPFAPSIKARILFQPRTYFIRVHDVCIPVFQERDDVVMLLCLFCQSEVQHEGITIRHVGYQVHSDGAINEQASSEPVLVLPAGIFKGKMAIIVPMQIIAFPNESYYGRHYAICHFFEASQKGGRVLGQRQFFFLKPRSLVRAIQQQPLVRFLLILNLTQFNIAGSLSFSVRCDQLTLHLEKVTLLLVSSETSLDRQIQHQTELSFQLPINWVPNQRRNFRIPLPKGVIFPTQRNELFQVVHYLALQVISEAGVIYRTDRIHIIIYR